MKRIGIFDSGIGGVAFAKALESHHPDFSIRVIQDSKHVPYGTKMPTEIERLTDTAIQPLLGYDVIVLACNTATAYAIDYLRIKYPQQKFVGFEPAIKIARGRTKTANIAILATPATLKSPRYLNLKAIHGIGLNIYEPDLSTLAYQIEHNSVKEVALEKLMEMLTQQKVDTVVLGCTHYHLIQDRLRKFAGPTVEIILPTQAVIRHIEHILGDPSS